MAQNLPNSDAFANTAFASQPSYWNSWVGLVPDNGTTFEAGWLHDGYTQVLTSLGLLGGAACTFSDSVTGSATTKTRGFAYRRSQAADIDVDASFQIAQFPSFTGTQLTNFTFTPPPNSYLGLLSWSVFARCTTGTLTDTTLSELRYINCTAYELRVSRVSQDLKFEIWRWNTGTATLVARTQYGTLAPYIGWLVPLGLRLRVETVGGSPTFKAYVGPIYILGFGQFTSYQLWQGTDGATNTLGSGATNVAGTITDAHVNKITGSGHVGVAFARDRTMTIGPLSSSEMVDVCHFVRARDLAGVVSFEERWSRNSAKLMTKTVTDAVGPTIGRLLSCDYSYDQHAGTSIAKEFAWDSANQRAKWTPASSGVTLRRFFLGLRPADNSYNQRRSVSVLFDTAGSEPTVQVAGVMLRGTQGGNVSSVSGYALYAHVDYAGANTYTLKLSRFNAGTETILATAPGAGVFAVGAAFSLDLDCHTHPDAPSLNDAVRLIARVDGSLQTWTATTGLLGVLIQSGGNYVVDTSADRIKTGDAEGLYATHLGTNVRFIALDTWAQGTLQSGALGPDDMATIAIAGEGTAVDDLEDVIAVDFAFEFDLGWQVIEVGFESGHVATRPRFSTARRTFQAHKSGMTEAERDDLIAVWNSHFGAEVAFNWTPPNESAAIKVAILQSSLTITQDSSSAYSVSFTLIELLT